MTEEDPSTPPLPPPGELRQPEPPHDPLEYLRSRLERAEAELLEERDRGRKAQELLRLQEELRGEADRQLKTILEQLKAEKAQKESDEEKARARGRIDALEARLDQMHQTWAGLLQEAVSKREAGAEGVAEELRRIAAQLERRLALLVEENEARLSALARERAALAAAQEEERHRLRQELGQERLKAQEDSRLELERIRAGLAELKDGQEGVGRQAERFREAVEKLQELLARPPHAKDQLLQDLDREKGDLMKALRDRNDEFRRFVLERREVERSLGESLMELGRQLDAQRAKAQDFESQRAELGRRIAALQGELELSRKAKEAAEALRTETETERERLAKILNEQEAKLQAQNSDRLQGDKAWETMLQEQQKFVEAERAKRQAYESQIAGLESKALTLSDHIARALQEKDRLAGESAGWLAERERLTETLRKKDEMLAMLSSTFQNLLTRSGKQT